MARLLLHGTPAGDLLAGCTPLPGFVDPQAWGSRACDPSYPGYLRKRVPATMLNCTNADLEAGLKACSL
ncbi:hypothetical protein NDU88_005177 [Pleurodeles waltl]|uniref:Uncharacterized protein n=1 Tax=Pleurodeles waltl TaxID=8319 RepID=A0AAV7N3L2_PLEWA|nr:hypothetical protein NDU88_005177 [Pleurodeles waltl]